MSYNISTVPAHSLKYKACMTYTVAELETCIWSPMCFSKIYHDDFCWHVSCDQHKSLVETHCGASCSWKQAYTYQPCSKFPPWSQARGSPVFSPDMRVLTPEGGEVLSNTPLRKDKRIVFSWSSVFLSSSLCYSHLRIHRVEVLSPACACTGIPG